MQGYLKDIAEAFHNAAPIGGARTDPGRVLKCPICAADMTLERWQGVGIDVCQSHGIWFDVGEAQRLVQRVQSGERTSARQAVTEARRDGHLSAMFFGLAALFIDDD